MIDMDVPDTGHTDWIYSLKLLLVMSINLSRFIIKSSLFFPRLYTKIISHKKEEKNT